MNTNLIMGLLTQLVAALTPAPATNFGSPDWTTNIVVRTQTNVWYASRSRAILRCKSAVSNSQQTT